MENKNLPFTTENIAFGKRPRETMVVAKIRVASQSIFPYMKKDRLVNWFWWYVAKTWIQQSAAYAAANLWHSFIGAKVLDYFIDFHVLTFIQLLDIHRRIE